MTGSLLIAKVFDIPVKLHWSFALLILWIAGSGYYESGFSIQEILIQIAFVLSLFFCVVLHEYGHALTARKFGVNTRDIILSPIGGIARLDKLPEKPIQEFLVAIAGPAVNIAIALLLLPYFIFYPIPDFFEKIISLRIFEDGLQFIPGLILLNVILAAFNLIPAFPMDGGRILRSLLSLKLTRLNATRVASYIGQFFAVVFIYWAIMSDGESWVTGLIGVFIFFTAKQELESAKTEAVLTNQFVPEILNPNFTKLLFSDSMEVASDYLKQGEEQNFLVFDEESEFIGSLDERSIIKAIKSDDLSSQILKYTYRSPIPAIYLSDNLKTVYEKIYSYQHPVLPVLENGNLIGVVDEFSINDFLKKQRKK